MHIARWIVAVGFLTGVVTSQEDSAELQFARISVKDVQPKCFASNRSPVFSDRMVEGTVIRVGGLVGEYRRVHLPVGVTGYIHKNYSTEPEEGMVSTTGTNVAFRYRPRSGEAPAMMLPKGAALFFMADEGDWYMVRSEAVPAYLTETEIQVLAEPNATIEASYNELEKQRHQDWTTAVSQHAEAVAAAAAHKVNRDRLLELTEAFRAESIKESVEQDFSLIAKAVDALAQTFDGYPVELAAARALKKEVTKQALVVDALMAVAKKPKTENVVPKLIKPKVVDPLAKFQGIGWLRFTPGFRGEAGTCVLEKGGRTIIGVTCINGRYDLSQFDGFEVGVLGTVVPARGDQISSITASRIEILGKRQ